MPRRSNFLSTVILALLCCHAGTATAAEADSLSHWGASVYVNPGRLIVIDEYQRKWQKKKQTTSIGAELTYTPLPSDSNAYAHDFDYPTFAFGLRYSMNDITMHRDNDWGTAKKVDYYSKLGNIISAYATFNRPFFRTRRFSADYTLGTGISYAHLKYDKDNNVDDELIGSHLLIYFTTGLHATYRIADKWGLKAGVDFYHHSNGAMERPNKGANIIGPSIGIQYIPAYDAAREASFTQPLSFQRYWYVSIMAGVGIKTLNEDWQLTQFRTPQTSPDYRTEHFHKYVTYSLQPSVMYRYARRWASGLGVDLFYGSYADDVEKIDLQGGYDYKHSPWSIGLSAKHEVFYGNWSAAISLGYYLYREMGRDAEEVETPYYEQIGIHYTIKPFHNMKVGFNLKAHKTKADYTELMIAYPISL